MNKRIKDAIGVGFFVGVATIVSQYVNFRIQGENFNFAIYVLILIVVAVVLLMIILMINKIYNYIKEKYIE